MYRLWNLIENKDWKSSKKCETFVLVCVLLSILCGIFVWLIIRNWVLSGFEWLICFISYPVFISLSGAFIYSANHAFHSGKPEV